MAIAAGALTTPVVSSVASTLTRSVEPDQPDYVRAIFDAFDEALTIPDEVWRKAEQLHAQLGEQLRESALRDFVRQAQTAEASGTAYPPTVTTSDLTDTPAAPTPMKVQQDLVLSALIVLILFLTWISVATQPFPQSLIPLLALAIEVLWVRYQQLNRRQ